MKPSRSIICLLVLIPIALSELQLPETLPPCSSSSGDSKCVNDYVYYEVADDVFTGANNLDNTLGGTVDFQTFSGSNNIAFSAPIAGQPTKPLSIISDLFSGITKRVKIVAGAIKKGVVYVIKKVKAGAKGVVKVFKVGAREIRVVVHNFTQPIYPGTRWCGPGDKAYNSTDLGVFKDSDSCCMHHDQCSDSIIAGKEKHGLNNRGTFTRSHCDCDKAFYYCLKRVKSTVSKQIGYVYFNVLKPQCFRKDQPVRACTHIEIIFGWFRSWRCNKYLFDKTADEKIWQWFDSREF